MENDIQHKPTIDYEHIHLPHYKVDNSMGVGNVLFGRYKQWIDEETETAICAHCGKIIRWPKRDHYCQILAYLLLPILSICTSLFMRVAFSQRISRTIVFFFALYYGIYHLIRAVILARTSWDVISDGPYLTFEERDSLKAQTKRYSQIIDLIYRFGVLIHMALVILY